MTYREYLLACLSEECAEVQKLVGKSLRFGLKHKWAKSGPGTNESKIAEELGDIEAIKQLLLENGVNVYLSNYSAHCLKKKKKVERLTKFSRKSGNLK